MPVPGPLVLFELAAGPCRYGPAPGAPQRLSANQSLGLFVYSAAAGADIALCGAPHDASVSMPPSTAGHDASVSLQLHAAPRASRLRLQTRRTTETKAEGQSKRSGHFGPSCGLPGALGGPHAAHHLAGSADLSTSLRSTRACADASAGILEPCRHSQTVEKQRTVQCSGGAEFPCRCRMGKRAC